MKKKFLSLVLLAAMTLSSVAHSEPTIQPVVPDQTSAISPMRKGQTAPFTGVLFSPGATASIIADISTNSEKIAIEVEKAVKASEAKKDFSNNELKTQCTSDKKILQAAVDSKTSQLKTVEEALKKSEDAVPSRSLWTGIGFVGGIAVTVLSVFVVNQATK